jgi:hypothetical protein
MKKEETVHAKLTDKDLERLDALARDRGISREEMLRAVIVSGVEACEKQPSGGKGPGEKGGT